MEAIPRSCVVLGAVVCALWGAASVATAQEEPPEIAAERTDLALAPAELPLPRPESVRMIIQALVVEAQQMGGVLSDQMTERYFRTAARTAARRVPADEAPAACLLALGIALDDQGALARMPLLRPLCEAVESPSERQRRIRLIGSPTIFSRRDLCLHFVVSAGLTVVYGPQQAEAIGLLKELRDAMGGTGFSFDDYLANLSGIATAVWALDGRQPVDEVLGGFTIAGHYPNPQNLQVGLQLREFSAQYGSIRDPRFVAQRKQMLGRIADLPGFAAWAARSLE